MKKIAFYSIFIFLTLGFLPVFAQEESEEYSTGRRDVLYDDIHASQKKPIPLPYLRPADVVWEQVVWRTIDLKQRFNQYFYYPTTEEDAQGRVNFMNAIWKAVQDGKIKVYEDDEFKIAKDFFSLENEFNRIDTFYTDLEDDDGNYVGQQMNFRRESFENVAKDFNKINIKERWYIDKARTEQNVRIVGISFVRDIYRENDMGEMEFRGIKPFGWIRMEAPGVRELLAQTQAYNEYNDAAWFNYDDVFLRRYFESFITRISNTSNSRIEQRMTGVDVLVEAEKLENDLLNKELDMWEW